MEFSKENATILGTISTTKTLASDEEQRLGVEVFFLYNKDCPLSQSQEVVLTSKK